MDSMDDLEETGELLMDSDDDELYMKGSLQLDHANNMGSWQDNSDWILPSCNNNPSGINGKEPAPKASDKLRDILDGYYKQGMRDWKAINTRLQKEHGNEMAFGRSAYFRVTKQLGVGTSRKDKTSVNDLHNAILAIKAKDPLGQLGLGAVQYKLQQGGKLIPRAAILEALRQLDPEGIFLRNPINNHKKIVRSPIISAGPNEQWSIDGHDKLSSYGIGIYGIRDVYSGKMLAVQAMPHNRRSADVHYVFLSTVLRMKGFPLQIASDRGSEIGDLIASQVTMRRLWSDVSEQHVFPYKLLKSTRNITIERSWRNVRENIVDQVKYEIGKAFNEGIVCDGDPVHSVLLGWIIPPFVQYLLDDFMEFFNGHCVRFQKNKQNPSGASRDTIYFNPSRWGGKDCIQGFPDRQVMETLVKHAEEQAVLTWSSPEVAALLGDHIEMAQLVYPPTSWGAVWDLFQTLDQAARIQLIGLVQSGYT